MEGSIIDGSLKSWLEDEFARMAEGPKNFTREMLGRLDERVNEALAADPFQRDPDFVASMWPFFKLLNGYMGSELRGWENVPKGEPVLFVGNHSGGATPIDPIPLMMRWMEARGSETPLYALAYNLLFAIPSVASVLRRGGVLPASPEHADRVHDKGDSLIAVPGGDHQVLPPWSQRKRIDHAGRMGFIELAIRKGVRVVPMTIHGAHESTFVMTRGKQIARTLGIDKLKVKVFPISWTFPFGPAPAFIPSIPLPTRVTVELGAPLDWSHYREEESDDPEILQKCYDEISGIMQGTLTRLAEERPYPVLSRLDEMRPSRIVSGLLRSIGGSPADE
jgi:1-acyl-sn-glycerol-3-phosphate acyltransferase